MLPHNATVLSNKVLSDVAQYANIWGNNISWQRTLEYS